LVSKFWNIGIAGQ